MFFKPTENELQQLEELTKEYDTRIEQAADEEEKKALRDECSEKLTDLLLEIDQRHFEKIATSPDAILKDAKLQIETAILHAYEGLVKYGTAEDRKKYVSFTTGEARLFSQAAAECAKIELVLHFDALKDNPEYTKRLFALIAEIVKTSEYTDNEEITLVSELHHPAEVEPVIVWAILKNNMPMYHGRATDAFAMLSNKDAEISAATDRAIFTTPIKDGSYKIVISDFSKLKGKLNVNTHKLFSTAIAEFTQLNNYKSGITISKVTIPLKEYARWLGYEIDERPADTAEEAAKEKKRAAEALKTARKRIKQDLEILHAMRWTWKENVKGKPKDYLSTTILESQGIVKGNIIIEFGRAMAEYLRQLPITQYPRGLLGVDARNPNAYRIGLKMAEHYNMDNNQIRGTADRLKVNTLLAVTGLPTIEDLQNEKQDNSRQWETRIKEPFETALDELTGKVIKSWEYAKPKGEKLADSEAYNITDYYTFKQLLVKFELLAAPDHAERLERRAKDKKKAEAKKAAEGKRRKDSKEKQTKQSAGRNKKGGR